MIRLSPAGHRHFHRPTCTKSSAHSRKAPSRPILEHVEVEAQHMGVGSMLLSKGFFTISIALMSNSTSSAYPGAC